MSRFALLGLCLVGLGTLVGCIEQSIVVKVNQDNSAVIHVRNFAEKPISFGKTSEKKRALPTRDRAEAIAAQLGSGVTLEKLFGSKNASGWEGYEAVFQCDDINKLVLDVELLSSLHKNDDEDESSKKTEDEEASGVHGLIRFSQQGDTLTIKNELPDDSQENQPVTRDPFAKSKPLAPTGGVGAAVVGAVIKRVRVGVFVQLDRSVRSTNARHYREDMITLSRVDGSEMPDEAIGPLMAIGSAKGAQRAQLAHELAISTPGLEFDLQPEITVNMK